MPAIHACYEATVGTRIVQFAIKVVEWSGPKASFRSRIILTIVSPKPILNAVPMNTFNAADRFPC